MNSTFYWIAVAAITVIASARITRLAVYDKFPPVLWIREKYLDATDGNNWQLLGLCGYCASFWFTALVVGWGWLAGVYQPVPDSPSVAQHIWFALFGTLAGSYLAAVFVANDGDSSEDDPHTDDDYDIALAEDEI